MYYHGMIYYLHTDTAITTSTTTTSTTTTTGKNQLELGRVHCVLVEGPSRKSATDWQGRSDTNKTVILQQQQQQQQQQPNDDDDDDDEQLDFGAGDYVLTLITGALPCAL